MVGISVYSQEPTPPITKGQMQIGKFNSKFNTTSNIETNNNNYTSKNLASGINKNETDKSYPTAQNSDKPNGKNQIFIVKDDSPYTLWLVIFTGLLFVCNVALGIFTNKAANAAKKAADALPTIERAYVFVNMSGKVNITFQQIQAEEPTRIFTVPINLINEGKTPAVLKKIYAGIIITRDKPTIAKTEQIIEEKPFNFMEGNDIDKREIRGGEDWHAYIPIIGILDRNYLEFLNIEQRNDPPNLYCCGKIVYRDIMKKTYTTWFCWELGGRYAILRGTNGGVFYRSDNDELNDYT